MFKISDVRKTLRATHLSDLFGGLPGKSLNDTEVPASQSMLVAFPRVPRRGPKERFHVQDSKTSIYIVVLNC